MRVILQYTKSERLKFISHLDLMRAFHRALRRAELPVAYSQGFSPHPKLSFASALPVGMSSEGEYADAIFSQVIAVSSIVERLNTALPQGLEIIGAAETGNSLASLNSLIGRSLYEITTPLTHEDFLGTLQFFMDQPVILAVKQKKDEIKYLNIRPFIHEITLANDSNSSKKIRVLLDSGSKSNLKPQLLLESLAKFIKYEDDILSKSHIHRLNLYLETNKKWVTPLELLEENYIG